MRLISDDALAIVTVYQEAAAEPFEGKVAVGHVILNRMAKHHESDGTIAGTVLEAFAFSGWNSTEKSSAIERLRIRSVQIDDSNDAVSECRRAWAAAQEGSDITHGALFYFNPAGVSGTPSWVTGCDLVATIGHHRFYRPKQ